MPREAQAKQRYRRRQRFEDNRDGIIIDITPYIKTISELKEKIRHLEEQRERLEKLLEEEQEITRNQKETIRILKESADRIRVIQGQKETIEQLLTGRSPNSLDPSDPKGYYKILGLRPDAFKGLSESRIKAAISKLRQGFSLFFHPDRGDGGNEERMKVLNEALDVLEDPKKRAEYTRGILQC